MFANPHLDTLVGLSYQFPIRCRASVVTLARFGGAYAFAEATDRSLAKLGSLIEKPGRAADR
jgi:hypothetical protein